MSSQIKTTENKSYRGLGGVQYRGEKSENTNIMGRLDKNSIELPGLTEENLKLFDENFRTLEREDEFEFYSNNNDQN